MAGPRGTRPGSKKRSYTAAFKWQVVEYYGQDKSRTYGDVDDISIYHPTLSNVSVVRGCSSKTTQTWKKSRDYAWP
eukprot:IDg4334t1